MSILIKGMEMPKDGEKLYMITFSDGKACASYKPFEWHEVVPVPPHGRCIDADALLTWARERDDGGPVNWVDSLDLTIWAGLHTIIPPEEGEA